MTWVLRRRAVIALLCWFTLMAGPAGAQESTPTGASETPTPEAPVLTPRPPETLPPPDYVLSAVFDLIYPTALLFDFRLGRPPEDFAAVTLTLDAPDWSSGPISVNVAAIDDQPDGETRFIYQWDIPADDPPPVFEDLSITWAFTEAGGETGVVTATLPFADPRAQWSRGRTSDGLVGFAVPAGRANATAIARSLDASIALLQTSTGLDDVPTARQLVFYDRALPVNPCQGAADAPFASGVTLVVRLPCDPAAPVEAIYAPNDYSVIELPSIGEASVRDAITGQLFDQVYAALWDGVEVPAWFREGLRTFYLAGGKPTAYQTALNAARTGGLLRTLDVIPADDVGRTLWAAQSYGLVLYMAEQVGVDGLFAVARALGEGQSLAAAYATAGGGALSGLSSAWGTWLFTPMAASAYGYSPYLPTTPTPTQPPTLTPTITRTFTPSRTPTITPSITGILSPTPGPSRTPSPTLTPSLTLRAPGSLPIPTSTPTPDPTAAISAGDDGRLLIGIGLIALGVVIALGAFALRGRGGTA